MEIVLVKEDKERKRTEREPAPRARKREAQKSQSLPLECTVLMNRREGVTQITAHRTIILREQIGGVYITGDRTEKHYRSPIILSMTL